MYTPKIELLSFATLPPQRKQIVLRALLEMLVVADWNYILENPSLPSLYDIAPKYILKVRPAGLDAWQDIPQTLALGSGDCKDFACNAAHIRVATKEKGEVPIADVKVGDEVATRFGWKKVAGSRRTRENAEVVAAELSNGRTLIATPDHLVWTANRKFIPLGEVRPSDALLGHDDGDGASAQNELHILSIKSASKTDVYDLAVEGAHEFFAEGVLVHNCWRIAELRNQGYDDVSPHIKVSYHEDPKGIEPVMTVYHIQVRIHDIIEDPSAILGMPTSVTYEQLRGGEEASSVAQQQIAAGMFTQTAGGLYVPNYDPNAYGYDPAAYGEYPH